jgi:hypothetical protein
MNIDALRRQVGAILDAEESDPVNWSHIERRIDQLEQQLRAEPASECPEVVWHYLSDVDIRALDHAFAAQQREAVRRFVETGEYSDGTRVSPWTCALVLAGVGGLVLWLVL